MAQATSGSSEIKIKEEASPSFRRQIGPRVEQGPGVRSIFSLAENYINEGGDGKDKIIEILGKLTQQELYALMVSAYAGSELLSCTGGLRTITTVFSELFLNWWNEHSLYAKTKAEQEHIDARAIGLLDEIMQFFDRKGLPATEQLEILNTEMKLKKMRIAYDRAGFTEELYEDVCAKTFIELLDKESDPENNVSWPELHNALRMQHERLLSRISR